MIMALAALVTAIGGTVTGIIVALRAKSTANGALGTAASAVMAANRNRKPPTVS
jgi:hypothetical protein